MNPSSWGRGALRAWFLLALGTGGFQACAPTALLQSPDALRPGDWEIAVGAGGAVTAIETDERDLEVPAFDLAWRIGISESADMSARAFYSGDAIGLYIDAKTEVLTAPVFVSPVMGLSVAAGLDGGSTVAVSPGFMVGLEEIWAAPRAVVIGSTDERVLTGFGLAVGSSLGERFRVMPEVDLFYMPADFERSDLYLGFTVGLAYRRERNHPGEIEAGEIESPEDGADPHTSADGE